MLNRICIQLGARGAVDGTGREGAKRLQSTGILAFAVGPSLPLLALLVQRVFSGNSVNLQLSLNGGHVCFLEISIASISWHSKNTKSETRSTEYLNNMCILIKMFCILNSKVLYKTQKYLVKNKVEP